MLGFWSSSSAQRLPLNRGDFVFPELNELTIGDPCTIEPSSQPNGITYARDGICRRVRECASFVPRIILEPFDIRRDVCFFEVHDPVVCCIDLPVSGNDLQFQILRKRLAVPVLDDTNMIQ
ncbi:uncharacterized protein LOC128721143 [Anopheles nili]|uniref:uncharacterized protein LOC128721143 n=1 Tax=Anopheles nili TaxID=185578 RepID=UPI00237C2F47|nr:uncharacterized protein LOC128721143 [Anopheles nili]